MMRRTPTLLASSVEVASSLFLRLLRACLIQGVRSRWHVTVRTLLDSHHTMQARPQQCATVVAAACLEC